MFNLMNSSLEVQMLDPISDRARFGVRYCTGGYIFQVKDSVHGDLLSGPTFPGSFNWFDGQGIPDAFNLGPLNSTTTLGHALIIGIGVCDLPAKAVRAFCDWRVRRDATWAEFETEQTYEDHALTLVRTVTLINRTIRSHTTVRNEG